MQWIPNATTVSLVSQASGSAFRNRIWCAWYSWLPRWHNWNSHGPVVLGRPGPMLKQLNASPFDINHLSPEASAISISKIKAEVDSARWQLRKINPVVVRHHSSNPIDFHLAKFKTMLEVLAERRDECGYL